jgi:hypothetical protein
LEYQQALRMLEIILAPGSKTGARAWELTEAEHDIEKDDQDDGHTLDKETGLAHPEWTRWHILTTCQEMWCNSTRVRGRGQDNKGPYQIGERSLGP